ncbi:hypothetical protein FACS189499_09140 [Clostridia bacterium]|nr:hypothetical protein FACS189499_09140 [Clostridia bacterium]
MCVGDIHNNKLNLKTTKKFRKEPVKNEHYKKSNDQSETDNVYAQNRFHAFSSQRAL